MTLANSYINRSIDLCAYYGIQASGEFELIPMLFTHDIAGQVCTGIQKLVQRWLITLLTPRGSILFDPDRGTDFITDTMFVKTETDVQTAYYLNSSDAEQQLLKEETEDMSADERFHSTTLLEILIREDSVHISVQIQSQGGEHVQFFVPLAANPVVLQ